MQFTQYQLVREISKHVFKWQIAETEASVDDFDLLWSDHGLPNDKLAKLKPHQRVSQLPGINCITRKNLLAQNLNAMKDTFGAEFDFFPSTYLFPKDKAHLAKETNPQTVYIVKPEASSQGKGIYLTRDIKQILEENCVV